MKTLAIIRIELALQARYSWAKVLPQYTTSFAIFSTNLPLITFLHTFADRLSSRSVACKGSIARTYCNFPQLHPLLLTFLTSFLHPVANGLHHDQSRAQSLLQQPAVATILYLVSRTFKVHFDLDFITSCRVQRFHCCRTI